MLCLCVLNRILFGKSYLFIKEIWKLITILIEEWQALGVKKIIEKKKLRKRSEALFRML